MNELVSNKRTAFLLIITLVVLILGAIYYFLINPLQNERDTKENNVKMLQTEVAVLNEQYQSVQAAEGKTENAFQLEKKVPITRELDELIRSIEEIELISESQIESISFNNYDEVVAKSPLAPTQTEEETNAETTETIDSIESADETETPISPVANIVLPPQLKLITFNISVLTKDFNHINQFVEELEKMERIVRVDQLSFSLPGEEQFYNEDTKEAISAEIQVTTFYYDGE